MMKKSKPAADPAAYVAALHGWRRRLVVSLRRAVRAAGKFDETIKWGNLLFLSNGPAIVIRAEARRVLFVFFRGKRLRAIEPRLKPGGKYEMATIEMREGEAVSPAVARKLARAAIAENRKAGDPTRISKG